MAGSDATWHRRLRVGLLTLGESSWVSHEAAVALHGPDRTPVDPVEFTFLRVDRGPRTDRRVHTTETLPPIDRVEVIGFRRVAATRTLVDLARTSATTARLEAAIDNAVRLGLTSPAALGVRLAALRGSGRAGARLLDGLRADSGGHSMSERRFLELVRGAGLPRPATQVSHRRGATTFARVDFLFEPYGVVIEVSGRLGHSSERARDAQRRKRAPGRRPPGVRVHVG